MSLSNMPSDNKTYRHAKGRALMIIPTYNESGNIERLISALFSLPTVKYTGYALDVMVRDDSSPDGTGEIVNRLISEKYGKRLILSQGTKQGLGKALQLSFDEALCHGHDVIMTMDADFSHSPDDVIKLLRAIDQGADVAIGSRYIEGGLIPGNWPVGLIIRTRIAGMVARLLGGINPTLQELTTNFRAMRRSVLSDINYNSIKARGYGFQIFLANAFSSGKYKITEVPISFYSRAEGQSKARASDIAEFFRIAYQLNDDSPVKQLLRFSIVGMSGTIVNLSSLWVLRDILGSETVLISLAAIQMSIIWNFVLHNLFTFKAYKSATKDRAPKERIFSLAQNFMKYQGATSLSLTIIFLTFVLFSSLGVFYIFAQALGILFAFVINYYLSNTYIWKFTRKYA